MVELSGNVGFTNSVMTNAAEPNEGIYSMGLSTEVPQTYMLSIDESTIPGGGIVIQPVEPAATRLPRLQSVKRSNATFSSTARHAKSPRNRKVAG